MKFAKDCWQLYWWPLLPRHTGASSVVWMSHYIGLETRNRFSVYMLPESAAAASSSRSYTRTLSLPVSLCPCVCGAVLWYIRPHDPPVYVAGSLWFFNKWSFNCHSPALQTTSYNSHRDITVARSPGLIVSRCGLSSAVCRVSAVLQCCMTFSPLQAVQLSWAASFASTLIINTFFRNTTNWKWLENPVSKSVVSQSNIVYRVNINNLVSSEDLLLHAAPCSWAWLRARHHHCRGGQLEHDQSMKHERKI